MKKFLAFIFLCSAIFSALALALVINFRYGFFTPQKVKAVVTESNIYEIATIKIREILLDNDGAKIDDGPALEIINASVTTTNVKTVVEKGIDQFFAGLPNHTGGVALTFSLADIEGKIKGEIEKQYGPLPTDQSAEALAIANDASDLQLTLPDNFGFNVLASVDAAIYSLAIACLFALIAMFALSGRTLSPRFVWLGSAFFIIGLFMLTAAAAEKYILPTYLDQAASLIDSQDQKVTVAVEKVAKLVLQGQIILSLIEAAVFGGFGIILIWFGRGIKEEKMELLS